MQSYSYAYRTQLFKLTFISLKNILLCMVEAAGVEPASETTNNREHSCFSRFAFVS